MSGRELTGAEVRRERNRREMRASILDEARKIVTEQGMVQLSMRAIARNLGYSPGALYEYFRDKEAIVHGLYFDGTEGLGACMEEALAQLPPETSAVDAILAMGRAYRSHALANAELYRLTFGAATPPPPTAMESQSRESSGGFLALHHEIERGLAERSLAEGVPEVVALTCWSIVHGFVGLEITGHIPAAHGPGEKPESEEAARAFRDAAFEQVLRSLMTGLAHHAD